MNKVVITVKEVVGMPPGDVDVTIAVSLGEEVEVAAYSPHSAEWKQSVSLTQKPEPLQLEIEFRDDDQNRVNCSLLLPLPKWLQMMQIGQEFTQTVSITEGQEKVYHGDLGENEEVATGKILVTFTIALYESTAVIEEVM